MNSRYPIYSLRMRMCKRKFIYFSLFGKELSNFSKLCLFINRTNSSSIEMKTSWLDLRMVKLVKFF